MTTALLLIDIQNDFLPGGALAVTGGDVVVPIANQLMRVFGCIIATQDWRPPHHMSFAAQHAGKQPFETVDMVAGDTDRAIEAMRDAGVEIVDSAAILRQFSG